MLNVMTPNKHLLRPFIPLLVRPFAVSFIAVLEKDNNWKTKPGWKELFLKIASCTHPLGIVFNFEYKTTTYLILYRTTKN